MDILDIDLTKAFSANAKENFDTGENRDLIWSLDQFKQKKLAQEFMLRMESLMCIYSPSVQQIYSNFNVFFPREENHKMMILPNPFAYHDSFHGIPENAVKPTGISIVPDYFSVNKPLLLRISSKHSSTNFKYLPLVSGLKTINEFRPDSQPLLPIIVKGDLREHNEGTPSLHLHSINLNRLEMLSPMEVVGIRRVIEERLSRFERAN